MTDPAVDIHGLLRTLVEQQTALLGAHAESLRLQRVLVERMLGAAAPLSVSAPAAAPVAVPGPRPESESGVAPATGVQRRAPDEPRLEPGQPAPVASVVEPRPTPDPAPVDAAGCEQPISAPRSSGSTPMRSDRYYQASTRGSEQAPPRPISLAGLDVLRCIQAAGEVAYLVLTFGPHAGEPLGQVAQSDPDYLRELARAAQRPDVRAAAARLVETLPSSPPPPGKRTSPRSRRGAWRGTS
jgi:hypothetical protein